MSSKGTPSDHHDGRKGEILRMGYLKKLKTMKKKFFILRGESMDASARLEYYDSEKKWRSAQPPKRTISLKTCFNINRRRDTKQKYVIALYTKDDCFCIVLDSEEDLQEWLKVLLKLQAGEDCIDGEPPKPTFEHVWKVSLQEKGLGDSKNLVGPYHVCLTDQTLSLVKITNDDAKPETLEFPLIYIRSCGVTGSFFYIEVGRQTVTGAGELWMLTEDANIAKNMNAVIFSAFSLQQKDQKDADPHRKRSSSATESSKPTSLLTRRQTHGGTKPLIPSGYSEDGVGIPHHGPTFGSYRSPGTTQCTDADLTPTITTISEHSTHAVPVVSSLALSAHSRSSALHFVPRPPSQRRHSVSAMSSSSVLGQSTMVQHQRTNSIPFSSNSESSDTCDGPTLTVIHQRTKSCPVSESTVPIPQDDQVSSLETRRSSNPLCPIHRDRINSQSSIDFAHSYYGEGTDQRRSSVSGRRTSSVLKGTTTGMRERSDSMPSRNRTTSEGGHHVIPTALPHATRVPHHSSRPHSMHSRGLSYSPPAASGPCSTDSAGSSLSIDDGEVELAVSATSPRYGHSSTPDEPAIIEENCDDYTPWSRGTVEAVEEEVEKMDDYVQMDRPGPSLSLPIQTANVQRKVSAPASLKSSSPLHSYMEICSPCGSSPLDTANYLPMSPGEGARRAPGSNSTYSANHSRGSSFAEETPDGYVPMAPNPSGDDGYVDMEPLPGHRLHGDDCHHSDMSPGSSCSFTSGTPSTDMKFSEYHLDKVSSYFTPSEEDEISSTDRPPRTYSFGSQPDTVKSKGKLDLTNTADSGRVRAFSVGSKWGRPRNLTKETHKLPSRSHVLPQGTKSSSAPLLSSSWSGTSRHAQSLQDPMADLMEIDFTDNKKKKRNTSSSRFRVTPVMETSSQSNLDLKSSLHTVTTSSADSGYMDMSSKSPSGIFPISKNQTGNDIYSASPPTVISGSPRSAFGKSPPKPFGFGRSPPKLNSYFGRSPPKSSPLAGPEGTTGKPLTISSLFSPPEISRSEPKNTRLIKPAIISSSTLKTIGEKPDVKPQKFPTTSSANLNIFALPNKLYAPGRTHENQTKDDQNYMEMRGKVNNNNKKFTRANSDKDVHFNQTKNIPEGYMEMSWGGSAAKLTRKSSADFNSKDDYMPMGGGSQPIAIRGSSTGNNQIPVNRATPPKVPPNFLALGNSSPLNSIRRNRGRKNRRKNDRRGSKENVTTPTGSNSAIFPLSLSSPTSPKKNSTNLVEANESTTPTNSPETSPMDESPYTEMNLNDEDSPYAEMTPGVELEDRSYSDIFNDSKVNFVKENETDSSLSIPLSRVLRISSKDNSPTSHDYMNFAPHSVSNTSDDFGEYTVMKPINVQNERKISAPVLGSFKKDIPISKKTGSITEISLNTSTSVPFSATANISDPKSVAQKSSNGTKFASSPLPQKIKPNTPKDGENEDELSRLSSTSLDNSKSLKTDAHSSISRQISTSSTSSSEFGDRKSSLKLNTNHSEVSRQISTSSSSSTEVMSVKDASSPIPPPGASRPSSVSSERDITYASLDLAPSGSEGEDNARSPRGLRTQSTESSGSSPSPNPTVPSETFTYVEIDFEKSGSLRAPQSLNNKKIRH